MSTDLKTKTETNLKTQTSQGLSVRSLDDLPATEKFSGEPENLAILGDISGSMSSNYSGSKSRYDGLQEALTALWEITDWQSCEPEAWVFDHTTQKINFSISQPPRIPHEGGGTSFSTALSQALENEKRNRIILASDGQSAYPSNEVEECQKRQIPIDTIFIGTDVFDPGAEMLQRIADETGGTFALCSDAASLVQQFQQLETNNRLLLTHQAGELPGPDDVIKL